MSTYRTKTNKYRRILSIASIAVLVLIIGLIGLKLMVGSHASALVVAAEPEAGSLSGTVIKTADNAASGGDAVKFGANMPIAKPDSTNTGVPAGHTLTVPVTNTTLGIAVASNGNVTISKAGTFDDMLIHGRLSIKSDNVTIRYSKIEASPNPWDLPSDPTSATECQANGSHDVEAISNYGYLNFILQDSTIAPTHLSSYTSNGIHGSHYTLLRVNISGTSDGAGIFNATTADTTIDSSFIHDLYPSLYSYSHACGPDHSDGIQIHYGTNITIKNSTIRPNNSKGVSANSAIQVTQSSATNSYYVNHLAVTGNWLDYGACSLNIADSGKLPTIQYLSVLNNKFGKNQTTSPKCVMIISNAVMADPTNTVNGSAWEDGSLPAPTVTKGG